MAFFRTFVLTLLLITTPSLLLYPQSAHPITSFSARTISLEENNESEASGLSFDEILNLLDELEEDEIEERLSPQDLERLNHFLALLAKEGDLEEGGDFALEGDIEELLEGEDNLYMEAYLEGGHSYLVIPAIYIGEGELIYQTGWLKKKWKKTKDFVKKHKKEIIIGAAVVVAATVVVVAVVAVSSAAAVSTAAAGAGAAVAAQPEKKEKEPSSSLPPPEESMSTVAASHDVPLLKGAVDEHVASFKEFLIEDRSAMESSCTHFENDPSFGEKIRELGAFLAHDALKDVSELAATVPQLAEEVKSIGEHFLPEYLVPNETAPSENYASLVEKGHQAIDRVFSTDQTECFLPTNNEIPFAHDIAQGILPLPNGIPKLFSNTGQLIEAGKMLDRAGFTRAGRSLMKHGYRKGSLFPKPLGTPAQINQQGEAFLKEIVSDPKRIILKNNRGGIEIYSQSGRGAYFREDGTFRGFIEYGR